MFQKVNEKRQAQDIRLKAENMRWLIHPLPSM